MPRTCSVCTHARRVEIERALLKQQSFRIISGHFRVSKSALSRHREKHLAEAFARAKHEAAKSSAETVAEQAEKVRQMLFSLLDRAERGGDKRTMISAFREIRGYLELIGRLQKSQPGTQAAKITDSSEWAAIREALADALSPFPKAREAVARTLSTLGAADAIGA